MKKIILSIVLLLLLMPSVRAIQKNDVLYSDEWLDGIFTVREKAGVRHYQKARIIRRKSDNKPVYCTEPFVDLTENSSYTGYINDYSVLKLTKTKWEKIKLIAYYGYGYQKHTTKDWYAVAQIMIWRVIDTNNEFYFTDTLNGNKTTKYDSKIDEINTLIKNHKKKPSFMSKEFVFSINTNNVLKDSNKVLDTFKITGNEDIEIDGNSLIINSDTEKEYVINMNKTFNRFKYEPISLINGSSQKSFLPGDVDPIEGTLKIRIVSGTINITKKDYETNSKESIFNGSLTGTTYSLYNDERVLIETLEINDEGKLSFENLPFGTYYVKETQPTNGYELDDNEYEVIIDQDNLVNDLELYNKAIKKKVTITKCLDDDTKESNIDFELSKDNEVINTYRTDENGKIEIELYYGKYKLHQLNTTKNYIKVDDFNIDVNDNTNNNYVLHDQKFSSYIRIIKKDKDTNERINKDAIFEVYKNNVLVDTIVVNKEGISNKKLEAGEYYIIEKEAPYGYTKSKERIYFTIDDENEFDADLDNNIIFNIVVYNEKKPSMVVKVPNTSLDYDYSDYIFSLLNTIIYRKKEKFDII